MNRIYVGNLNFATTEGQLHDLFSTFGDVQEVHLVCDHLTGRSRGFAFVSMPNDDAAHRAIEQLHQSTLDHRLLTVNVAKPRP